MRTVAVNTTPASMAYPWKMLLWLLMAQIMVAFIGRSLGPLGVLIGEDLSLTKAQIGLLPSALFLGQAMASIPSGFVADRTGSRPLLLLLSLCLGTSFLFMTFQSAFWFVLFLVMIGGLGYGGMHPTTNRGIIYWFSQKQRGTAMGIKQMGITFGSALSAILLLPLAASYGWRPVMLIACLGLIATGLVAFYLYRDPSKEAAVAKEKPTFRSIYSSILSMAKNKALLLVSFSAMGVNGSQMCLNTYLVLFAYEQIGISLVLAGMLLVISEIGGSLGRVGWGVISDRLFDGKRLIILVIIVSITLLMSVVVAFIPVGTPFWVLVPIFLVFGFSVSGFNGIWMNLASELVPKEQTGLSSGFSITLGSMGVILLPPLFGFLVDQNQSYTFGWLLISGIMIGVLFVLASLYVVAKENVSSN
ncbi:MFS transporter [Halobacillus shinanisalinarum]|uniref:MFS transporter n=1 Tax=Halobacillus shinanisalinarum TaxID=2932258 RepID=A0ABY4H040_9BACI|nr:MFS transporter [Halobacillus shinanisalinarum]UOQ92377.1 MFS transporter [Halobacillus shinanisalinarum]